MVQELKGGCFDQISKHVGKEWRGVKALVSSASSQEEKGEGLFFPSSQRCHWDCSPFNRAAYAGFAVSPFRQPPKTSPYF